MSSSSELTTLLIILGSMSIFIEDNLKHLQVKSLENALNIQ